MSGFRHFETKIHPLFSVNMISGLSSSIFFPAFISLRHNISIQPSADFNLLDQHDGTTPQGRWGGGGAGIALAITTLRFPVITRGPVVLCEAAWAVAAPGGSRPCCPVTSWSGDTPLEVPRSQPSEWTGGPPAARVLASGGRLPRQLPLPSGVYFGSVLLRFSPGIAGSVRAGPRLEVTLLK